MIKIKFLFIYKSEFRILSNKLENYILESPKTYSPLGPVKEIWIYSTTTGVGFLIMLPNPMLI